MREMLFRGIRKDNGQWVEGKGIDTTFSSCAILVGDYDDTTGSCMVDDIAVIPETVGQCTGLADKNGKKIFEGDIVVVYVRGYHTVCTVSWAEIVAHFQLWQINTIPKTPTALNLGNYDCEVIGNIHDNPELLKGGEGE